MGTPPFSGKVRSGLDLGVDLSTVAPGGQGGLRSSLDRAQIVKKDALCRRPGPVLREDCGVDRVCFPCFYCTRRVKRVYFMFMDVPLGMRKDAVFHAARLARCRARRARDSSGD